MKLARAARRWGSCNLSERRKNRRVLFAHCKVILMHKSRVMMWLLSSAFLLQKHTSIFQEIPRVQNSRLYLPRLRNCVSVSVHFSNQNENTPHSDNLHIGIFPKSVGEREARKMAEQLEVRWEALPRTEVAERQREVCPGHADGRQPRAFRQGRRRQCRLVQRETGEGGGGHYLVQGNIHTLRPQNFWMFLTPSSSMSAKCIKSHRSYI